MKQTCNLLLFILFWTVNANAQKEANFWFFGNKAGLDFSSGKPIALSNSELTTDEGCSVISDAKGNLLFYTDGISVWNKNHELMENGTKLLGDPSSTQSSVAIAHPKLKSIFYLFTVAATAGDAGISYSIIDISRNGGKGAVLDSLKNTRLLTPVTEKLTSVMHRNGKDVWVIAHGWKNNQFHAFLVTEKGVQSNPITTAIGTIHDGTTLNTQGYMKFNPDGSNLALALEETDVIEIFDFDNATGVVSEPISLSTKAKSYVYGIEFSADGSIMYYSAAGTGEIFQVNLQAGSPEKIQRSTTLIGKTPKGEWIGALQLANDGKIYFPIYKTSFLGVIEKPGELDTNCAYRNNAVFLGEKTATLGLPTFFQSYFTQDLTQNSVAYFDVKQVQKGKTFILQNILFSFGKYDLLPRSYVELDKVVLILQQNPTYKIEIMGHTDNIGNKSSNIILSENRAKAVETYLISKKIAPDRISVQGFGSGKPIANNGSETGRAKNRRVEFRLM